MVQHMLAALVVVSVLTNVGGPAPPAAEIHSGKVIIVEKGAIVVMDDRDMDNDRFVVTAETKITRNNKPAKLMDIQPGDRAKVEAVASDDKLVAKSVEALAPE